MSPLANTSPKLQAEKKLISLVKDREILYKGGSDSLPFGKAKHQANALWAEIAQLMGPGWNAAECKRKWSHIRNSYSRHLRNEMLGARTMTGRAISKWHLADEVAFLRNYMATDLDRCSVSADHSYLKEEPYVNVVHCEETQSAEDTAAVLTITQDGQADFGMGHTIFGADLTNVHEPNEDFLNFFRGIYQDFISLSSRRQRLFKQRCLGILYDLADEQESKNTLIHDVNNILSDDSSCGVGNLQGLGNIGTYTVVGDNSLKVKMESKDGCPITGEIVEVIGEEI